MRVKLRQLLQAVLQMGTRLGSQIDQILTLDHLHGGLQLQRTSRVCTIKA